MSLFNLKDRVKVTDLFVSRAKAVEYDLIIRKSAMVPNQKFGDRILEKCKPGYKVLDVGFGIGLVTFYIGGKMPDINVFGVESNQYLHEVAADNLNLILWGGAKSEIELECNDLTELPYDDKEMDIVYSYSYFHLWEDPVAVLKECIRVCKDDGLIVIEDFNRHAEEGYVSFVLQFVKEAAEPFMDNLRAGYTTSEIKDILTRAGLASWHLYEEDLDILISSKEL